MEVKPSNTSIADGRVSPSFLHRSEGKANFAKCRQRSGRNSENRLSRTSRRSVSIDSPNSQILYMSSQTPKKRRDTSRSLSSIGNGAGRRDDDASAEAIHKEKEPSEDADSRHIIDREIWEWQYVCQSGRPYWWSPEAKESRLQRIQRSSMASENQPQTRMYTVKTGPQPQSDQRRKTFSDSYLSEARTVHDLAHLIAVQLLGACFTLPPDSITAGTPGHTRNEDGISVLKDPQLISSLRMHTHFRYSPSFGHQARNTSPVQLGAGRYDGPKSASSPIPGNTGSTTPNIGTSSPCYRRPRLHRAPHNTEGSEGEQNRNDEREDYHRTSWNEGPDPTMVACAWYRKDGGHDPNKRSVTLPHIPASSSGRAHSLEASVEDHDVPLLPTGADKTKYRLQAVIRSEPHHVFIQPVRELVVERWRNFRRRFSGSLHSSLPTGGSDEIGSASDSSASEPMSPPLSSGAKARRRRAQERGDIHSSSVESAPHYNTPMSGHLSPSSDEPQQVVRNDSQTTAPTFRLADPLAAAASLVVAKGVQEPAGAPSLMATPANLSPHNYARSPAWSVATRCGTGHANFSSLPENSIANTPSSSYSIPSPQNPRRSRRRSMLSEVCTPADLQDSASSGADGQKAPFDRNALSATGTAIASPHEEIIPTCPLSGGQIDHTLSSPAILPAVEVTSVSREVKRPRMSSKSTSGTQVFSTDEDGVEIDGLPVGPARHFWRAEGREEHTYL